MSFATILPLIFMGLLGLSALAYAILDGFDLGVGMLMPRATRSQKDTLVASIGPFWDANETWLVLVVGLLLVAFPKAQGRVLSALYLPVFAMLFGLILRGVAFDFRVKAADAHRAAWNAAFAAGSALASVAQGWALGRYVAGLREDAASLAFAALVALVLPATYVLLGACWLVLKTDGPLQARALRWARAAWPAVAAGFVLVSVATPWVNPGVGARWLELPGLVALPALPLGAAAALVVLRVSLASRRVRGHACWLPFACVVGAMGLAFLGLAYSVFPYVVVGELTVWQAASSTATLGPLLVGVSVAVPMVIGYTVLAFRVFRGKASRLVYA